MPSYPAGMTVSNRALNMLADALRHRRRTIGTRWRRLKAALPDSECERSAVQ